MNGAVSRARRPPARAGWLRWRGGSCQSDHPDKVVGSCHQVAGELGLLQSDVARTSEPAYGLHPAKDLFHPFADALTDGIPSMTRRSAVDGAAPPTGVLRHMRADVSRAEVSDTVLGVVALVRAQRPWAEPTLARLLNQVWHRIPLGRARCLAQLKVDQQSVRRCQLGEPTPEAENPV